MVYDPNDPQNYPDNHYSDYWTKPTFTERMKHNFGAFPVYMAYITAFLVSLLLVMYVVFALLSWLSPKTPSPFETYQEQLNQDSRTFKESDKADRIIGFE